MITRRKVFLKDVDVETLRQSTNQFRLASKLADDLTRFAQEISFLSNGAISVELVSGGFRRIFRGHGPMPAFIFESRFVHMSQESKQIEAIVSVTDDHSGVDLNFYRSHKSGTLLVIRFFIDQGLQIYKREVFDEDGAPILRALEDREPESVAALP